jgi:hypothetical protein
VLHSIDANKPLCCHYNALETSEDYIGMRAHSLVSNHVRTTNYIRSYVMALCWERADWQGFVTQKKADRKKADPGASVRRSAHTAQSEQSELAEAPIRTGISHGGYATGISRTLLLPKTIVIFRGGE